jgi:hypothetical protein
MERPTTLEEVGFKRECGVLINEKIYIVEKLLRFPKHDWLLVIDEDGNKFKALVNTCQRIDSILI